MRQPRPLLVVANDPRLYRDVVGATVRALRPDLDVLTVGPDDLEQTVRQSRGGASLVVVCSYLSATVAASASACIVLYPEGLPEAALAIKGRLTTLHDVDFPCLLAAIDQALT